MLKFTIGSDISKDKINFALRYLNDFLLEREVENTTSFLNKFIKEVLSFVKKFAKENKSIHTVDFITEHTGIYGKSNFYIFLPVALAVSPPEYMSA
ncbi:MAG: hypothetical protein IPO92_06915 [Saprospiraceae bacterium]|nr:hypothetical protein [Saprospiraceae bacterium]